MGFYDEAVKAANEAGLANEDRLFDAAMKKRRGTGVEIIEVEPMQKTEDGRITGAIALALPNKPIEERGDVRAEDVRRALEKVVKEAQAAVDATTLAVDESKLTATTRDAQSLSAALGKMLQQEPAENPFMPFVVTSKILLSEGDLYGVMLAAMALGYRVRKEVEEREEREKQAQEQ